MKQIIDISDELFSIFKKHGIMAFDYFNEYDKDQIAIAIAHAIPCNPSGDAISRKDLKLAIREMPDWCGDDAYYSGVNDVSRLIDNAPTVPQVTVFAENADEKAIEDMKAELQSVIADLKAELQNVIESRPQGKCEKCDFRKFSEQFIDSVVDVMTNNGITSVEQLNKILKGGPENVSE